MPVIAVVAAAPAFATSGANLSTSTYTRADTSRDPFRAQLVIVNGGSGTTAGLTVTFTISNLATLGSQPAPPTGWTIQPYTGGTAITFVKTTQVAAGETAPSSTATPPYYQFNVERSNSSQGTVSIVVDPGGSGTPANFGPITL